MSSSKQNKAKRRAKRKQKQQSRALPTYDEAVRSLIGEFARTQPNGLSEQQQDIVETIFNLHRSHVSERPPLTIDADAYDYIVTELLPGKVVADDDYFQTAAGIALPLADYLAQAARPAWKPRDLEHLRPRLEDFAEQVTDRDYRRSLQSMGTRIAGLAQDEGVDLSDPDALQAFMERYNAMPQEWRKQASEPGEFAAGPLFTSDEWDEDLDDEWDDDEARYDSFMGGSLDDEEELYLDELDEEEALTVLLDAFEIPLPEHDLDDLPARPATAVGVADAVPHPVQRILQLLEWVRVGDKNRREVTGTDAIKLRDVTTVAEMIGLTEKPKYIDEPKMSDYPALDLLWRLMLQRGLLEHATRSTVRVDEANAASLAPAKDATDAAAQVNQYADICAELMLTAMTEALDPIMEQAMPAILELAGGESPPGFEGFSLDGMTSDERVDSQYAVWLLTTMMRLLRGIAHAVLEHGSVPLIDVTDVPPSLSYIAICASIATRRWIGLGLMENVAGRVVLRLEAAEGVRRFVAGEVAPEVDDDLGLSPS